MTNASLPRRALLAAGLGGLAGCASGSDVPREAPPPADSQTGAPPSSTATPSSPPAADLSTLVEGVDPFEVHVGFWENLHHWLFCQVAKGDEEIRGASAIAKDAEPLSAEQHKALEEALAAYRAYGEKDPMTTEDLASVRRAAAATAGSGGLPADLAPAALAKALATAKDVYAAHAWPIHRADGKKWIDGVRPLVEKHGASIVARLSDVFRAEWPAKPTRVDLAATANWAGAYTTLGPVHLFIASRDARNQGSHALEILFHEASHAMMKTLQDALSRGATKGKKPSSGQLWHVVLFYTVGVTVQKLIPEHQPYAEREGIYKGQWGLYRKLVDAHWQPYLDGKKTWDAAIDEMAKGLP